jgi:hypothetical protein
MTWNDAGWLLPFKLDAEQRNAVATALASPADPGPALDAVEVMVSRYRAVAAAQKGRPAKKDTRARLQRIVDLSRTLTDELNSSDARAVIGGNFAEQRRHSYSDVQEALRTIAHIAERALDGEVEGVNLHAGRQPDSADRFLVSQLATLWSREHGSTPRRSHDPIRGVDVGPLHRFVGAVYAAAGMGTPSDARIRDVISFMDETPPPK